MFLACAVLGCGSSNISSFVLVWENSNFLCIFLSSYFNSFYAYTCSLTSFCTMLFWHSLSQHLNCRHTFWRCLNLPCTIFRVQIFILNLMTFFNHFPFLYLKYTCDLMSSIWVNFLCRGLTRLDLYRWKNYPNQSNQSVFFKACI